MPRLSNLCACFMAAIASLVMMLGSPCCTTAQVRYVSSSRGSDANSGLTEDSPLKTINAALKNGKDIRLAAGDVFCEYVVLHNQTLTRYGEGHNPELNGLRTLVGRPWVKFAENVWRIDLTSAPSTGYVVEGSTTLNNVGCLYETDKDELHGRKCFKLNELQTDWDFFQADLKTYQSKGEKCFDNLYLYYSGNPNDLQLAVSIGSHYGIKLYDSNVERVNVKGFGTGGINLYGTSNVRGCRVDVIGGSIMLTGSESVCLGNGIDFWISKDATDCVIEGNYISRCYDCGGSIQGDGHPGATPRNIVYRDNLISHCCQGWEDFLRNGDNTKFENCRFENNYIVYTGLSGFGYPSKRFKYCNVLGNNFDGDRGMIIRNNTFVGGNYYCSGAYNKKYQSNNWDGNVHYIERGSFLLGNYGGTKDVIRIPSSGSSKEVVALYRELTNDTSTKFKVRSASRIDSLSQRTINKYLKTHTY